MLCSIDEHGLTDAHSSCISWVMDKEPNAASVAIFSGNSVLLIKRAFAPYRHCWTFPGGRLEPGETAIDCAQREVFEEVGLEIEGLVPVTHQTSNNFTIAVFATVISHGTPTPSNEVADWYWGDSASLKQAKTTPNLREIIAQATQLVTPV